MTAFIGLPPAPAWGSPQTPVLLRHVVERRGTSYNVANRRKTS